MTSDNGSKCYDESGQLTEEMRDGDVYVSVYYCGHQNSIDQIESHLFTLLEITKS
jgi:hypothetical protein